ncbi:MAG: hypothetical protein AAF684_06790 [Pseudomonadota bacterium]
MPLSAMRLDALRGVFSDLGEVVVACSGGVSSLILAAAAHRFIAMRARIVHIGVASAAAVALRERASAAGWDLTVVSANALRRPEDALGPKGLALIARMSDAPICAGPAYAPDRAENVAALRAGGANTPLFDLKVDAAGVRELAQLLDLPA